MINKLVFLGGRHNFVVSSAPTILRPGFESQAHHLRFFQFVLLKLYQENNENKQKEVGIGPFKKTSLFFKMGHSRPLYSLFWSFQTVDSERSI